LESADEAKIKEHPRTHETHDGEVKKLSSWFRGFVGAHPGTHETHAGGVLKVLFVGFVASRVLTVPGSTATA
jgi:hypothetical protein